MRRISLVLLVSAVSVASFVGGTMFGVRKGIEIGYLSGGLLRAEEARHQLVAIENGAIAYVKSFHEVSLTSGLSDHYGFIHYPYKLLIPSSANYTMTAMHDGKSYDKIFMSRIIDYVSKHPESIDTRLQFDPQPMPEATEQDREWKEYMVQGAKDFRNRVRSVLNQYK